MQINLNIATRTLIIFGFILIFQPGLKVTAQNPEPDNTPLSAYFLKPEIRQKAGELSFNIARVINHSDSVIRFKPFIILPDNWNLFSLPYNDTLINPHDSISLIYRFKLPDKASSESKYEIIFRAYSLKNVLLAEKICHAHPEAKHDLEYLLPEQRVYFYPRKNHTSFEIIVKNKGNTSETINFYAGPDQKVELHSESGWQPGEPLKLNAFQDTVLKFNAKYISPPDRVFDLSKIQIVGQTDDLYFNRAFMIEKYTDVYSPFIIDKSLPHQAEIGFRTFSNNEKILPFIKTRGMATFKNEAFFIYNFNYYALTGNEDLLSNTYYNFLYNQKSFQVGLGAFSSQLGRNMYTRNGVMASNIFKLSPVFSIEAFLCQSIMVPKTSVASGFKLEKEKLGLEGSLAYDLDKERKVNTASAMLKSDLIPIARNHDVSFNLFGYHEVHDLTYDYTMMGFAWDLNYFADLGESVSIQVTNNYGSPNMPGTQMGLFSLSAQARFFFGEKKEKSISIQYNNSSRKFHNYTFEGIRLPDNKLYDQYTNLFFYNNKNPNHIWRAGPSVESFVSYRPAYTSTEETTEYRTQNIRFDYDGMIFKNLTLKAKTGLSNIHIIDSEETKVKRYDFHLMGGYTFGKGYGLSFGYDYGPMVNTGLYQFSQDVLNHSLNVSPGMMRSFLKKRIEFNLFSNFIYRIDLKYGSININPRVESFIIRDWYVILSGTYHFTMQQYPDYQARNSFFYLEFSIKKRWGKSDYNKWQKDTRQLRIMLFKDDNGNNIKDVGEQGVPFVKTRLVLTNTDNPNINSQFPVDITLLSNEKGMVTYNRLPKGFYDLSIIPLSDVKEYFYVNRTVEKIQLSKNDVVLIPFQKATKITGKLVVERQKFIKKGTERIDLQNIRITAYTNEENSYSSLTLEDGSFTIFVPGNNTYYLRMGNVFGSGFKILQNDIMVKVTDKAEEEIVFNIVEISRQIKFKDSKAAPADTTKQEPLKIKILQGKFYENSSRVPTDKDALPEFNIKEAPVPEEPIIADNFYVVIGVDSSRTESVKLIRIVGENGIKARLGFNQADGKYYVFTLMANNKGDAKVETDRLKQAGINEAEIIKF